MAFQETQLDSLIRRAVYEDMDQLVETCRLSFPQSLRWQSNKWLARQWWKVVLVSQAVQTWLVEENGIVTAFCVLVVDESLWARERFVRHGSIATYLLSASRRPFLTICRAAELWRCFMKKNMLPVSHRQMPTWWSSKKRTWIGLIAVMPARRNAGLAGILLKHCDCKTKELGRKAIALRVLSDNVSAKLLYEKHGYVCCRSDVKDDLYAKFLE